MELMTRAWGRKVASNERPVRRWRTTRPSMILGVRRGDRAVAFPALCEAYWRAVFAFICAIGCNPDDARDVTQSLFESMMKPSFFNRFDPSLGRFRNWLRTAAKRSYLNWKRKHRPNVTVAEELADVAESVEPASNGASDADHAFDRALIEVVVRRALGRLCRQYEEEGEQELFSQLERAVGGERQKTDDAAVSRLVGRSVTQLKQDRHLAKEDWKMRYRGCLREELAALGVKRSCIERVIAELLDAAR